MITIRNENDLYDTLERIQGGGWDETESIHFEGFPHFEITLKGERFDGGVPTRIMPALLKLQQDVDKAALSLSGKKRLDQATSQQIEIVVRPQPGSTTFIAELAPAFNILAGKMTGQEAVITVLFTGVFIASVLAWKIYRNSRVEIHRDDSQVQLSKEETRRAEVMASLIKDNPALTEPQVQAEKRMKTMFRRMNDGDELLVQDVPLVDGTTARRLARNPRSEPIQDRLDGEYLILSVDSGGIRDGFRVRVRNVVDQTELTVTIPAGTLSPDQMEQLQTGEWGKNPLSMQINITRGRDNITSATLVRAGLSE